VIRIDAAHATGAVAHALRAGAILAPADAAVLALAGPGAVTCFQGLLTNDIEKAGDGGFVYGALLTPKGMIVVDGWAARLGAEVIFTVPAEGRERAASIFEKSIPPRLARVEDRSVDTVVLRLAGREALALAEAARLPFPTAPGRVLRADGGGEMGVEVARASEGAPFVLQLSAKAPAAAAVRERLLAAGATWADATALDFARLLAGWPRLAAEVDDKTIPQEVRFDEIGGVSYTKGCYTGQETVSRLHFRGHANRQLRGLMFEGEPMEWENPQPPLVRQDERDVGRLTSVSWLPEGPPGGPELGRWIGLAVLRREVATGAEVHAAGTFARVLDLPFALPRHEPA
jgi:folate-binding protein YgfZ